MLMNMNLSELWEIVEDRGAWGGLRSMGSQRVRHDSGTEQRKQSDQKMSAIIQLLYSTGNYAQYLIITYNGKEYVK